MEWISINKALPTKESDVSIEVLGLLESTTVRALDYVTGETGKGKFYFSFKNHFIDFTDTVTHWMYQPKLKSK